MPPVRRILFIRTDRMGDVLMNLPALRVLRLAYPKAWITLMADASLRGLLTRHPDLDEFMSVSMNEIRSLHGCLSRAQSLRKARFDMAVVSNPDKFLHLMVFWAGIPRRIGYSRKWGFLLTRTRRDDKHSALRHEIESNLALVGLVSQTDWDGKWNLPIEPAALQSVQERLVKAGLDGCAIVVVHAGSSNPLKRWPTHRFAELCEKIVRAGPFHIVLVGGEEEKAASAEVSQKTSVSTEDWTGALSLPELAAFLSLTSVKTLISSDSGPVHVAWLAGKPVVALYARNCPGSDPARWGPRFSGSQVLFKDIADISADEVYSAFQKAVQA